MASLRAIHSTLKEAYELAEKEAQLAAQPEATDEPQPEATDEPQPSVDDDEARAQALARLAILGTRMGVPPRDRNALYAEVYNGVPKPDELGLPEKWTTSKDMPVAALQFLGTCLDAEVGGHDG